MSFVKVPVVAVFVVLLASCSAHEDEGIPLMEAAKQMLQDSLDNRRNAGGAAQGFGTVGGLLQSFIQSDGGRQLGDMLLKGGNDVGDSGPAADILSGIGSLLSGALQKGDSSAPSFGGLDPALIGHMMDIFKSGSDDDGEEGQDNEVDVNNNNVGGKRGKRNHQQDDQGGMDWDALLGVASSFMGGQSGRGAAEGLLGMLPAVIQSLGAAGHSHHEDDVIPPGQQEAHRGHHVHSHKSNFLPPFLDKFYDMWEHFSQSELGRTLWENSGLNALFQLFTDPLTGRFQTERIFSSLENASFRRRWIRALSRFVAEWLKRVADPVTQAWYLNTAQVVGNSFLQTQGYPKATHFDPARPAESLSLLANAVFKRHFGLKVNAATYIRPAVAYVQEVLRLGQSHGLNIAVLSSADIESRLADTLNGEIVEPVLRVWRAYKFSTKVPSCDAYVLCVVNRQEGPSQGSGIKPGVTKLSSMIAAWFMSGNDDTPFWKLYNAATEGHDCQTKYQSKEICYEFHEEDLRATTEYAHNEL